MCVLVLGLALVLLTTALAAPPSLEYKLGEMPLYAGVGYDPAPKVSVQRYEAGDSKLPGFYRGWTRGSAAVPNLHPLFHYPLDNNRAAEVKVPNYG